MSGLQSIREFHENSYVRELEVVVGRCDNPGTAVVSASIFFPGGGGQPADTGTLGGLPINSASNSDGPTVLSFEGDLPVGPAVMKIDWPRRFDHMQQHTSQHLVSHLMAGAAGLETVGYSMRSGEIRLATVASDDAISDVVETANQLIRDDVKVLAHVTADGVRFVRIGDVGEQPCGGTHVSRLGELQALALTRASKTSIRMDSGARLLYRLRLLEDRSAETSRTLGVAPDAVVGEIRRAAAEEMRTRRRQRSEDAGTIRFVADMIGARRENAITDLTMLSEQMARQVASTLTTTGRVFVITRTTLEQSQIIVPSKAADACPSYGDEHDDGWTRSRQGPLTVFSGPLRGLGPRAVRLASQMAVASGGWQ